jgi:hypothetical protein
MGQSSVNLNKLRYAVEHFTRWDPLPGIAAPCTQVDFCIARNFDIVLHFSSERNAHPPAMRLTFGPAVLAFTSYDEFAHPWNFYEHEPVPQLPEPWAPYAFPLLIVHNAPWFNAVIEESRQRSEFTHYRIVSLDHTVDVLAHGSVVVARWEAPLPV